MSQSLPINAAGRNAVWIYEARAAPRFADAPSIIETTRSHEMPHFSSLPENARVAVELYGGAISLELDGELHRIYIRRFEYVSFISDEDARYAFLTLWREVEALQSAADVEAAAEEWLARWKQKAAKA
jgi:hypothetical protein